MKLVAEGHHHAGETSNLGHVVLMDRRLQAFQLRLVQPLCNLTDVVPDAIQRNAMAVKEKLQKGETIQERFVDEKTGRLVGMRSKMPTPMGEIPTTTVIKSWITIGPRKVPSKTVIKMMGMEQVMTIDKVMTEPIDPEVFALPPAIKALAQARDAEKKTTPDSAGDSSGEKDPSSSSGEGR